MSNKLFLQRIGLIGVMNFLVSVSSLILLPILTKNMSVEDYGIWVIITVTVGLLPSITNLGLPFSFSRYFAAETDELKIKEAFYTITFIIFFVSVFLIFLLLIFVNEISYMLFQSQITISLFILILIIILAATMNINYLNYFRTFQKIKLYSFFTLLQTYVSMIIVSFLVLSGFGIYGVISGYLFSQLLLLSILILYVFSQIGFKFPKFENIKEYLSFGLPTIPSNLSFWIVDSSDRYIISIFLGTASVGFYSPGYTLGNVIMMFISPFAVILTPYMSKLYDANKIDEVKEVTQNSLNYYLLLALPSVVGLSILSKPIITILTTPQIASESFLVTPFICLSVLFFGIYTIISQIIVLKKRTKILAWIWIFAASLNLILNILFVPLFGIIGAAVMTLLAYATALIFTLYDSYKCIKLNFNFLLKSVVSSIIMSLFIFLIEPTGIIPIFGTIIFCAIIYFVLMYSLGGIKKQDIQMMLKFFH